MLPNKCRDLPAGCPPRDVLENCQKRAFSGRHLGGATEEFKNDYVLGLLLARYLPYLLYRIGSVGEYLP